MLNGIVNSLPTLAFFQQIGPVGLVVILVIALLIFGKRLPDVARSMGKGIVEFKKGLRGVEDEVDQAGETSAPRAQNTTGSNPASNPPPDHDSRD